MHDAGKELFGSSTAPVEQKRNNDHCQEKRADQENACIGRIALRYPTANGEVEGKEERPERDREVEIALQVLLFHGASLARHQNELVCQLVASRS